MLCNVRPSHSSGLTTDLNLQSLPIDLRSGDVIFLPELDSGITGAFRLNAGTSVGTQSSQIQKKNTMVHIKVD